MFVIVSVSRLLAGKLANMGLTKQYLAFKPAANFNIVASSRANVAFVRYNKTDGRYAAVGAAERVVVWDLR